jgi:hypothetical protein
LNKLKPKEYGPFSNKKVWWTCSKGHDWEGFINGRSKGSGCSYCANKSVGYSNDLESTNPEIAKQWHPTKNEPLKPAQVTSGSNEKVWWLCNQGHEWKSVIYSRKKHKCPKCFDNTSFTEQAIFYYISQIFPEALNRKIISINGINKEADVFIPTLKTVIEYDGFHHLNNHDKDLEKANFFLDNGYLFFSIRTNTLKVLKKEEIHSYIIRKGGKEENDLEKSIKSIIDKLILIANKEKTVFEINLQKDSIDIYNKYIVGEQLNSFASKYIEIAKEWHPTLNGLITPAKIRPRTHKKFWWVCINKHHYLSSPNNRARGRGCPYCVGKKIGFGNDFESNYPLLSKEWNNKKNKELHPSLFTKHSCKTVWWICSKGHEWEARIDIRVRGTGCLYCSNRKVGYGNDLQTMYPKIAEQWHPTKNRELTPFKVIPGSPKKVWWVCNFGHEWETNINSRIKGNGCLYCSNRKLGYGNDLQTRFPKIAVQWHPTKNGELTPDKIGAGSNKKIWWLCINGHESKVAVISRIKTKCRQCFDEERKKNL